VIEVAQLDLQKGLAKKSVRQVAGAARNFLAGLRKRMNAIAEADATQTDSGKGEEGEAGAGSPNEQADTPTSDSDATSVAVGAATDSAVDSAATTKPPRTQKGRALTSTDSASQASAPA
jgi:hypothetical protein